MAKTPRASKVSDATASGKTKPAKTTTAKPAKPSAGDAPARKKGSKSTAVQAAAPAAAPKKAAKKPASVEASAPKKAAKKPASAEAPAPKKAAKKKPASAEAPAPKKAAKKKTASAEAPAPKKAAKKKTASAEAPAPKKTAKKAAASSGPPAAKKTAKKAAEAPSPKKAAKKKPVQAPVSEQLALSMDLDMPSTDSAPTPASPLQPGDRVPDFSLQGDDGATYSRASLAGERFVIYFYPKDDTPGCTREACDFRDNRPRFEAATVKVLGVSGDSLKSHDRFRTKYELNFPLLADPERTVAQAFGVVGMKKLYGKESVGIIRSTFLVGPDGIVQKTFSPVKVDGHAEAVLQAIGSG